MLYKLKQKFLSVKCLPRQLPKQTFTSFSLYSKKYALFQTSEKYLFLVKNVLIVC